MTFAEYSTKWMDNMAHITAPATQRARKNHLKNHLLPAFGKKRVEELTQTPVQEFISGLSITLAPKTVRNVWGTLATILTDAERDGKLFKVPKPRIRKVGNPDQPFFSVREMCAIVNAAVLDAESRLLYHLLAETGVRIDEALSLEWDDVMTTHLRVRGTKTASARRDLVISRSLRDKFAALSQDSGAVFNKSVMYYRNRFNALLVSLSIPCLGKAPFHAFRRGARTMWGQLGMHPDTAELRLGHALVGVQGKYRFLTLDEQTPWAEKIAEALR